MQASSDMPFFDDSAGIYERDAGLSQGEKGTI